MTDRSFSCGNIFTGLLLVMILVGGLVFWYDRQEKAIRPFLPETVLMDGKTYVLEIADTDEERSRGLSGRDQLCEHCAMLFVFPYAAPQSFWMKGMRFPLDVVWLYGETVVHVEHRLSPDDEQRVYSPDVPADRVLEFRAGEAADLEPGEQVRFSGAD